MRIIQGSVACPKGEKEYFSQAGLHYPASAGMRRCQRGPWAFSARLGQDLPCASQLLPRGVRSGSCDRYDIQSSSSFFYNACACSMGNFKPGVNMLMLMLMLQHRRCYGPMFRRLQTLLHSLKPYI